MTDDPETKELADFLRGPVKKIIPPPAPPPPMAKERADLKLNKPKITPTVKMRGLFWTRIVLNLNNEGEVHLSPDSKASTRGHNLYIILE